MPLRPIDMQVSLPKVQDNKASRETVVNKDANALQQSQAQSKKEAVSKQQKILKNEKKEDSKIKKDKHVKDSLSKGKKKKEKKKKKSGSEIDKVETKKSLTYHKFDMKI
ncbi:hypothetical protein [Helicovermis profundi]|uniref:Uncharacterized protein n=1 Tax=Helicovermis profundi TaxID=3065157 RepID=A0AAU9E432_9FIRM|nr:hypothetical protein HLPR_16800 [Clostridia bacterium S502]